MVSAPVQAEHLVSLVHKSSTARAAISLAYVLHFTRITAYCILPVLSSPRIGQFYIRDIEDVTRTEYAIKEMRHA